jgi:hypothetical protein
MIEQIDTQSIKRFFDTASGSQLRCLMAVLDKMQDAEDDIQHKHVPIPLTAAILAQAIHQSEIINQRKPDGC